MMKHSRLYERREASLGSTASLSQDSLSPAPLASTIPNASGLQDSGIKGLATSDMLGSVCTCVFGCLRRPQRLLDPLEL